MDINEAAALPSTHEQILQNLDGKSTTKQIVYDKTSGIFAKVKEILSNIAGGINNEIQSKDKRVRLEYNDRGQFESEIKVASDILIFSMHSNVFLFDREHQVWKTSYVQNDKQNAYCGVISIYNFLSDSFKYSRMDDLGYLIGRIFINKNQHYFVEGKRQMGFLYNNFGSAVLNEEDLTKIIETAILYTLEFDLLVPPYDTVKLATVNQMNTKIDSSRFQTGKRLGFKFNSDDVLASTKKQEK